MSSRRERRKKQFAAPSITPVAAQPRVRNDLVSQRSTATSGDVRTISLRTLKIIVISTTIVVLLLVTAPKPHVPPGALGEAIGPQVQTPFKPVELDTLKTTIPPVNTSTGSALGATLKDKINIK